MGRDAGTFSIGAGDTGRGALESTAAPGRSGVGWGRFGMPVYLAVLLALAFWMVVPVRAGRPLAENIVFGSVWMAGRPIVDTNLVIEARRGDAGPVVARCRIGDDPGAGELFFLRIHRETAPALSPVAVDTNDVLTLVVTEAGRAAYRTHVKMPAPGHSLRIDFGRNAGEVTVTEVECPLEPGRELAVPAGASDVLVACEVRTPSGHCLLSEGIRLVGRRGRVA